MTKTVTRITYYDGRSSPSETSESSIIQYKYGSDGNLKETVTGSDVKVYDPSNDGKPSTSPITSLLALYSASNTEELEFVYNLEPGVSDAVAFDLVWGEKTGTYYYQETGYNVTVTITGGRVTIKITTASGGKTFKFNNVSRVSGDSFDIPTS